MSKEYQFIDTTPIDELLTYREIAKELQMTPMQVMRIERKALEKIRTILVTDPRVADYSRPNWLPSIYE